MYVCLLLVIHRCDVPAAGSGDGPPASREQSKESNIPVPVRVRRSARALQAHAGHHTPGGLPRRWDGIPLLFLKVKLQVGRWLTRTSSLPAHGTDVDELCQDRVSANFIYDLHTYANYIKYLLIWKYVFLFVRQTGRPCPVIGHLFDFTRAKALTKASLLSHQFWRHFRHKVLFSFYRKIVSWNMWYYYSDHV